MRFQLITVKSCQNNKAGSEEISEYGYECNLLGLYYINADKNMITATDRYHNWSLILAWNYPAGLLSISVGVKSAKN